MRPHPLLHVGLAVTLCASTANAGIGLTVTINGTVEYNQVNPGLIGQLNAGDDIALTFEVDSDVFTNSASFPTRGYHIDESSFAMTSGGTTIGLQSPFPGTPYFVLRDNDPAVDGFLIADTTDFPTGVGLEQVGSFGQFENNFYVTYGGTLLDSLDILDALGTYDFTGLTVFNWTIDDGPFNPVGMIFEDLTIECTPVDPTSYCTGKVNSIGCTPFMSADSGIASLSGPAFTVTANNLLNNKPGIIFYGYGENSAPFQGGTLCVQPQIFRTGVQFSGGSVPPANDCSGTLSIDLTAHLPASAAPGFVYLQGWSRDPNDAFASSLSDGIKVLVCP